MSSSPPMLSQNTAQLCKHPGLTSTFVLLALVQAILGEVSGTWALATVPPLQPLTLSRKKKKKKKFSILKNNNTPLVIGSRFAEGWAKKHTSEQEEFLWGEKHTHNKNPGHSGLLAPGVHRKWITFQTEEMEFALCIPCEPCTEVCGTEWLWLLV